ncbi:hypothetical protein F442_13489, partial [Phytophthora nicotianae P10297]
CVEQGHETLKLLPEYPRESFVLVELGPVEKADVDGEIAGSK